MPTFRSTVTGAERVIAGSLGYPWIELDDETPPEPVNEQIEFTVKTADAILADVGNDPELAAAALAEEQTRETPRLVLSSKLQRIVDNAES